MTIVTLLCYVRYDKNFFPDYNKHITHVQKTKMLNVSFQTFNAHIITIEKTELCQTKKMSYRRNLSYS